MTSVAVFGGGVGGLSAAHELAERGFAVTVYEANDRFGGKARSLPGPTRPDGSALPGEHGFRFFPGFYQHVTDTMSRIPCDVGTAADNLVETTEFLQATDDRQWTMATASPETLDDYRRQLWSLFGGPDVPAAEKAYFLARLLQLLTSCDDRWREQYDETSWWEYIDADRLSPGYRKILGRGITQLFVAVRPEVASTRTIGRIYLQMLQGHFDESMEVDYVLDGPTNEAWIDPWVAYLDALDVDLQAGVTVEEIQSDGERVTGVLVRDGTDDRVVTADFYVAALPVEVMVELLTPELERAAPSLRGIRQLETAYMNGIQYYLERDVPMIEGHGIYYDSPWALTTISQRQFWEKYEDAYFDGDDVDGDDGDGDGDDVGRKDGDGDRVEGILSVVISDWDKPGILYGKPVHECTPEEIKDEVWAQLNEHGTADGDLLPDDVIVDWFLDPAIAYDDRGHAWSREPLLINTVGSLRHRPPAATEADNLVLAADYIRTYTDLATMEAANEAARRAANAIFERVDPELSPCFVRDLSFPPPFDAIRSADAHLYRHGLPHPGSIVSELGRAYDALR